MAPALQNKAKATALNANFLMLNISVILLDKCRPLGKWLVAGLMVLASCPAQLCQFPKRRRRRL